MEIFCGKGSSTAGLHVYAAQASIIPMRPIRRIRVAEITSLATKGVPVLGAAAFLAVVGGIIEEFGWVAIFAF